jgi:hypothetical protein
MRHKSKPGIVVAFLLTLAMLVTTTIFAQRAVINTQPTPQPASRTVPPPPPIGGAAYSGVADQALCRMTPGCKPPNPAINGLVPFSYLTPGGYVAVYGNNFNSFSGPGGKMQFSLDGNIHDLTDLQWTDTSVGGRVPDNWNWPNEAAVDLWLVRADGSKSNSWRLNFTPTYDIQILPASAIQASCSGADHNRCPISSTGPSIDTSHSTTYGHDAGTDHYTTAPLRNWALYDFDFSAYVLDHGSVQAPSGFMNDYNYLDLQVHWDQDGGNICCAHFAQTQYSITIYIRGPKGYSWH